jgi:hypothetical protein
MAQPESNERKWVWLLCLLAALHVFIFSAAFPFFNNVDEQAHFDLAVKYSHGEIPRRLEPVSAESAQYIAAYGTLEFLGDFHGQLVPPPPWTQPPEQVRQQLFVNESVWKKVTNWEATQPPLYYALAGAWWNLGQRLGFEGGHLLYWLRFLNIFFVAALVWLGHLAARLIFPGRKLLRLGVPALLAFMPQSAFYSVENDVLSPLCFGAAFVLLIKFLRADQPGLRLGTAAGLALAATSLVKNSNLPLLAVALAAVLFKFGGMVKSGQVRAAWPSLLSLFFCVTAAVAGWTAWCEHNLGNFTGMEVQARMMGMTLKPFGEWWHHPIFTPPGFWIFIHDLLATFWRGEIWWHRQPLALPPVDMVYVVATIFFTGVALLNLRPKSKSAARPQLVALWFGLACFIAAVAFLGFLSIIYDFNDDFNPSREHPYFSLGRLMLGALVPFLLLLVYGLDRATSRIKNDRIQPLLLTGIILLMLASEIATDWPVFSSQYNWFHM